MNAMSGNAPKPATHVGASFDSNRHLQQRSLHLDGLSIHQFHVGMTDEMIFSMTSEASTLCYCFSGERKAGHTVIDGNLTDHSKYLSDQIRFLPAGCTASSRSVPSMPTDMTYVCLDENVLLGEDRKFSLGNDPVIAFRDEHSKSTIMKLNRLIDLQSSDIDLYAGALALSLIFEASSAIAGRNQAAALHKGGLSARQQKMVVEYIDASLADRITLDALSALAGVSKQHFCRAFRESFGVPPYKYVLEKRLQVSKSLLAASEDPITSIALDVGFANSSHFSDAFRRRFGVTASGYRRQLL